MRIAPSILAADLSNLAGAAEICESGRAELIHVDVMDGHFVPNLTFGPPVVEAFAKRTSIPLDVHLMVQNVESTLEDYLRLRPQWLSFHVEAVTHLDQVVERVRAAQVGVGVALNPATPIEAVLPILGRLDFVLLMSVNPGFGGQPFIPYVLDKARRLREIIDSHGLDAELEIDGGVKLANAGEVAAAGIDVAVVGSGIFGQPDPVEALEALKTAS